MAEPTLSKPSEKNVFRFSDYDCIGFDLDNTLCRYKLTEMVKLEYEALSNFLVSEKGYSAVYLLKPLEANIDFLQKGLVLDFFRGNVLQLRSDGAILKASHGTRFMSEEEIKEVYGADKKWETSVAFTQNMLEYWNGPLSERIRTVSDYFDMPAALAFGRIVDSLDAKQGNRLDVYNIWPDILDGLFHMFKREHFESNEGGYFSALKNNPSNYIHKCSNNIINWLKQIKSSKATFLITGSNVDFASFTASNCLGENWQSFFDIIVCYARKPGFFTGARPFIKVENFDETDPIEGKDLELGKIYSQGNWQDLQQFLARHTGLKQPKCLYIGDNLIQDVYVPSEYTKCDAVAIVEEQGAEGMEIEYFHDDTPIISSDKWGSYFGNGQGNVGNSFWCEMIKKHSKICVPDVEVLANVPLNYEFNAFVQDENVNDFRGYYPGCPLSLSSLKEVVKQQ
ncbi:hypothetical protein L9F63_013441 [Diploptera punctata]|uniref:5'-nucleotidase domain-containing protein 1 n=1 Tax=Diploptera punctata TaxID=6984 RepID=A0AAD8AC62_DIPPU|nr:hypothetical protein L9F63_013441 [Diploptera punctata]